jgi:hypothetical protein
MRMQKHAQDDPRFKKNAAFRNVHTKNRAVYKPGYQRPAA